MAEANQAPCREMSVVHSSFGRLRVHLPCWNGEDGTILAEALRGIAGVTHAEANPVTGNALILYKPGLIGAESLLAALSALRLDAEMRASAAPASCPVVVAEPAEVPTLVIEPATVDAEGYVTGWRRIAYQTLGWASVGMAVIGAILPGVPTAPFVVLAGYFFIRSSREAHEWLRQSRWFGQILRDWEDHRAVRRSIRNFALGLIVFSMIVTAAVGLPTWLLATIIALQTLGLAVVLSLRVVENAEVQPEPIS